MHIAFNSTEIIYKNNMTIYKLKHIYKNQIKFHFKKGCYNSDSIYNIA